MLYWSIWGAVVVVLLTLAGQREDTLPHCGILIWGKFWHEFGTNAGVTARDLAILSTSFHVQVY